MIFYTNYMNTDALHCVCADASPIYSVQWKIFYTNYMNMDTLQYVCVDVSSNYTVDWMVCYTHHMNNNAPHLLCTDVSTHHFSAWMTHDTNHMNNDTLHCVCFEVSSEILPHSMIYGFPNHHVFINLLHTLWWNEQLSSWICPSILSMCKWFVTLVGTCKFSSYVGSCSFRLPC